MAMVIEPIVDLGNAVRRKFRRLFEQLSEEYIIRSPVYNDRPVADIIIEGPNNTWLMISSFDTAPAEAELAAYLEFCARFKAFGEGGINYLAVTPEGASLFDTQLPQLPNLKHLKREILFDQGAQLLCNYMLPLSEENHHWLLKNLFPETYIHAACTTRREIKVRDTSVKLQEYFLDYDQEMAAKLDMPDDQAGSDHSQTTGTFYKDQDTLDKKQPPGIGVRLINGVAGCGKTLILMNRARLFCHRYPDIEILLLIHNKPITCEVKYKFEKYLQGKPDNLTIQTFHQFALAQQGKVAGRKPRPLFKEKDRQSFLGKILSQEAINDSGLTLSEDQLWSEIEYINEFLITDKATYLDYERQGRGFGLQHKQREVIWSFYTRAMSLMSSSKGYLPSLYIRNLCLGENLDAVLTKYHHILLDEAQFFSPSWLQLVIKSLHPSGQLFMCADPNQGFLKSRLSWKSLGLNVRGRTKKLHYSYRTTFEILIAANALLEHLDENSEDFIKPDLENMARGSKPKVIYSDSPQDEMKQFLNELKLLRRNENLPLQHIMVLCSEKVNPWTLKRNIERELGSGTVINYNDNKDTEIDFSEKIKLMSINSCTGMEAGVVFVLGVGDILNKTLNLDLCEEERELLHQESTRKLYVAMTRAGQKLILQSTEKLPAQMEHLVEIA